MGFAFPSGMELFFGSFRRPSPETMQKSMVVAFDIPELGIAFKAPFEGEEDHTEFASLLALLEFVDLNRKLFGDRALQIYGANLRIVQQINDGAVFASDYAPLLERALEYRKKYRYTLEWTPAKRNPAIQSPKAE